MDDDWCNKLLFSLHWKREWYIHYAKSNFPAKNVVVIVKKNQFGKKSSLSKVRHEVEVLCCVCSIHEIVCRSNVLVKHVPLYSGKRRIKYCNLLSNYGTWIVIEFKFWPEAGKKKYVDFKTRSILLVLLYEYEP